MDPSMLGNNLTEWTPSDSEIAYYIIPPYGSSGGALQLYIPKFMPAIGQGKPKITSVGLNKSCYCNAPDCKPSVSSKISTQNYITVQPRDNRSYQLPLLSSGAQLLVDVLNHHPDRLYINTTVDPSFQLG